MNKPIRRHSIMAAPLVLFFSSFAATNIQAQNEEATPSAAASQPTRTRQIEEVMVTARRVEESLQDTPVSVAAFSSADLEQIGASEPKDVAQYTPNLTIRSQSGSNDDYAISIRGIAEAEPALAIDPAVGIYVDGIYIARNVGMAFDIVDMERLEVLRGPQGTLFGRNTIGGAINIITAKPQGEFAYKLQAGYGNRDHQRQHLTVDTPTFGNWSAKLSFVRTEREGEFKSIYDGRSLGDMQATGYRAAVRWIPTDLFTLDYSFTRTDRKGNSQVSNLTHVRPIYADPDGQFYGGPFYEQAASFASPSRTSKLAMVNTDPKMDSSKIDGHTLTLEWDPLANLTVKSISSYRELRTSNISEFHTFRVENSGDVLDGRRLETDGELGVMPVGSLVPLFEAQRDNSQRQITQEFQFIGSLFDERLRYNTGLYYFEEDAFEDNPQRFVLPTSLIVNFAAAGTPVTDLISSLATTQGTASATLLARPFQNSIDNKAYAAYGDFTWRVTPDFEITVGARYTIDERRSSIRNIFDGEVKVIEADEDWSNFNPSITFDYSWSPEISTYFKVATGYRAGGFNVRATTESSFREPFDPEELTSYGIGLKSDLLDRTLRLNAAIFHFVYKNRQISQFEAGTGGASSKIDNAGQSETTGLELETIYMPLAGVRIIGGYGYLDVNYKEYITGPIDPVTGFPSEAQNRDISDTAATDLYAPEHNVSLAVEYQFEPWAIGQLTLRADANYSSSVNFHPQLTLFNESGSHTIFNARAVLADIAIGHGDLRIALWGKNLGNEKYRDFGIDFGILGFTENRFGALRSYGLDMVYSFNR